MASTMSLRALFLLSLLCVATNGDLYFNKDIGDCMDQGVAVQPGNMYNPDVCTTCKCVQDKVAECIRMICGACEQGQVAEKVDGQCCPKCVPAPTQ